MRIVVPNLVFFCTIGFLADMFNFAGAQAEILAANFVFDATEFQMGILGSISSFFYAIPTFLTGLLSEKLGRRPLVLLGLTGMGLSYAWGANANSVQELYLVVALRASSTAMLWPPLMAWMARAVPAKDFSQFLGTYNVSWAGGTFFGFWAAGYLFQKVGWESPFYASAALAAGLVLFVSIVSPRGGKGIAPPPMGGVDEESTGHGLSPAQIQFFVRQGLLMVGAGAIAANSALYLFPKVGEESLTEVQISLLNSVRLAGQMLTFFLMGRFAQWHFRRWPVWLLMGLLVTGLAVLAAGQHYYQFIIGCLLIGGGFGMGFSMCAYYALALSSSKGRGSGMMETTIGAGGLAGPLLGGAVANLTSARSGILSGAIPVALCGWLSVKRWPNKP